VTWPPRSTAREVAAAKLLLEREHQELREVLLGSAYTFGTKEIPAPQAGS
jgi:hypothetical protein